jgi:hypothetical protein
MGHGADTSSPKLTLSDSETSATGRSRSGSMSWLHESKVDRLCDCLTRIASQQRLSTFGSDTKRRSLRADVLSITLDIARDQRTELMSERIAFGSLNDW